jgi:ABC-2 type transport system ATP-binding protein
VVVMLRSSAAPTVPRMSHTLAVEAVDVTKRYGDLVAVDAVTLQVAQGEVYGVLGPNGAGKTTFLRMLFGLITPDTGTIRLFGQTRTEAGRRALDGVSGFIETPRFYPYLTGRQNLRGLGRLDGGVESARIEEVLEIVDLATRGDDKVRGYSYGMRQRLGVAASLLRDPHLLVLDEPANGLDPAGMRDMRSLIKRLAAGGLTVLLSSHDMSEVDEICDNVTIMRTGSVVYHGGITELRRRAPDQGHRITSDDDERVRELAGSFPALDISADPEGGVVAVGDRDAIDDLVRTIVASGIALRSLTPTEAPLETLFFMLTESAPGGVPTDLSGVAR